MEDLIRFLREQLDRDRALAESARGREPNWVIEEPAPAAWGVEAEPRVILAGGKPLLTVNPEYANAYTAEHVACHDPARVLADVAAKRRVLDDVVPQINAMDDKIEDEFGNGSEGTHDESLLLLKLLALPYAGHPEYRAEWRP